MRADDNAELAFGYDRAVTAAPASNGPCCNLWYAKGAGACHKMK